MPRRKFKISDFKKAIPGSRGRISIIASRVGCDWHTCKKYINENPTLKKLREIEDESLKDWAEDRILEKMKSGDTTMIIFFAKTQMKDRGYIERREVSGPDGGPIESKESGVIIYLPEKDPYENAD